MGRRSGSHRFMPHYLVFPGGAVDPDDAAAPAATPLMPETRALLERVATPALAHALAVAGARELWEETGLSLGDPPALDRLSYLCRAITPPARPTRFNARFLVAHADHVSGTLAGSGELETLRWYPVAEALGLDLALPTAGALRHFLDWLALPPAARAEARQVPVLRNQRWELE
jgi:8-oxo-dGTP pyrophosphatase MutT (NUDIX family)